MKPLAAELCLAALCSIPLKLRQASLPVIARMSISIVEEGPHILPEYAKIPIAFRVESQLRVEPINDGIGGLGLREEKVDPPYVKDYDQSEGEGPERWLERWDLSNWGILSAFLEGQRIAGAVVATRTPGVHMLEGRDDLAVLWDLRVEPEYRRQGIGAKLFEQAVNWSRTRHCRMLKVETQNNNVAACQFYAAHGCKLGAIHRWVYRDYPEEVQLLWYLPL